MQINLHLVCDTTGEVLGSLSRFLGSIFSSSNIKEYFWYLTKTKSQIDDIVTSISKMQDNANSKFDSNQNCVNIILSCFSSGTLELYLIEQCRNYKIPIKSATKNIVNFLNPFCGDVDITSERQKSNEFNQNYFNRIEAIEYTIAHDDGNLSHDLDEADILLIGPSRTSKTPVSVYLGYNGFKVANIPFVDEKLFDIEYLKSLHQTLIIGLTINPLRLENIRKTRLQNIGSDVSVDYADIEKIDEEVRRSKRLYSKLDCFVIDVTQRSVEETSSHIIAIYNKSKTANAS
jgi:regulator of PEP synthase PpsR (kinase-PPPase family)